MLAGVCACVYINITCDQGCSLFTVAKAAPKEVFFQFLVVNPSFGDPASEQPC